MQNILKDILSSDIEIIIFPSSLQNQGNDYTNYIWQNDPVVYYDNIRIWSSHFKITFMAWLEIAFSFPHHILHQFKCYIMNINICTG